MPSSVEGRLAEHDGDESLRRALFMTLQLLPKFSTGGVGSKRKQLHVGCPSGKEFTGFYCNVTSV